MVPLKLKHFAPVRVRRPQHTGEYVWLEPLAVFLRRKIWVRPDNMLPVSPRQGARQVGEQRFAIPLEPGEEAVLP